jgi:hypothetical protein
MWRRRVVLLCSHSLPSFITYASAPGASDTSILLDLDAAGSVTFELPWGVRLEGVAVGGNMGKQAFGLVDNVMPDTDSEERTKLYVEIRSRESIQTN